MTFDPNSIVKRLSELSRMLDAATLEAAQLDETAVRAKARHEVEYARAYLTGEGSIEDRKQLAKLATENESLDMDIAFQKLRACQERIRTLRVQIEVGRSLNAAQRSEWAAAGVSQP